MSQSPSHPDRTPERDPAAMLEQYLDRRLKDDAKEQFEGALRGSRELRAEVRIQQELNASLSRLFEPPAEGTGLDPIRLADARPAPATKPVLRRFFPLIAAAATVLVAVSVYIAVFSGGRKAAPLPGRPGSGNQANAPILEDRLGPLYQAQLAAGFKPETVCTTRDAFADWMQNYFGQPIYPNIPDKSIELVGWNYGRAVSSNSGVLLARVEGREVIVVVDRTVREKGALPPPADPALHSFRQQMGNIVLYEVSPLDHAAILPRLSQKADGG